MSEESNTPKEEVPAGRDLQIGAQLLLLALAGALVFLGVLGAKWFYANTRKHERKPKTERTVLVELQTLVPTSKKLMLRTTGTVVPARELTLQTQVGGIISKMHPQFEEGQAIPAGTVLLELDRSDYELAVRMKKADLAQRRAEYELELGQQAVAQSELNAATEGGGKLTEQERALITRQPQLEKIKAAVDAAEAALAQAKLNLERTKARVPFNAIIQAKRVDVGTQIATSTVVAELVASDEYWIMTTVPQDELRWIRFPDADGTGGAAADIRPAAGIQTEARWSGEVMRLLPGLEEDGRLAKIIVRVADPLKQQAGLPLLLGAYVHVDIHGRTVDDIFVVKRSVIHGDDQVWLRNMENRLEARDVNVLWRGPEAVVIDRGLKTGEHLVASEIASPIPGMKLRAADDKAMALPAKKSRPKAITKGDNGRKLEAEPTVMETPPRKPSNGEAR